MNTVELKRAIFLKGVYDPSDANRITTTLYRPKHTDLRLEGGFVRSGQLLVPMTNVVELLGLDAVSEDAASPVQQTVEAVAVPAKDEDTVTYEEVLASVPDEEPVRRRGRPRKNP